MDSVYITEYDYPSVEIEKTELAKAGIHLVPTQSHTAQEIIHNCHDAVGLIVQYAEISAETMAALPKLKVISRYGVGVDTIDLAAATKRGICVVNVPDYCIDEVSNQTFALLFDCWRQVTFLNNAVHMGLCDGEIDSPAAGSKAGLGGIW